MKIPRLVVAVVAFSAPLTLVASVASPSVAGAATTDITSAGPLTDIGISTDLNCSVNHTGDGAGEWYGNTACGTLLASAGTLYGPASIPAGESASPRTPWSPISQTTVTGSGTSLDPYKIVTVDAAGTSGLQVTETDSYVVGQESYRNDITVTNTGRTSTSSVLYRGGDCYLQSSDSGYGTYNSGTGAIACTTGLTPGSRIEQMLPLTAGTHYFEGFYNALWANIGTQNPFPDTCDCSTHEDNSVGLSWGVSLGAGATKTYSSIVTFSPLGVAPVTLTKTADVGSVAAGGTDGYTITAANSNAGPVTLATLTDTLGAGFSYQPGTTTGATTADPGISGQMLTWTGIVVPSGGTASVHFDVTAPISPNTYNDDAEGTATGVTIVGTGPTAPVIVTAGSAAATTLTVAAANGDYADATSVSGTLTNTNTSAAVSGKSVKFTLNGSETCTGTTNASGIASCSITPGEAAGPYPLAATFAGDSNFLSSNGSNTFTVTHEETALSYTGDTSVANGQPMTLSGVLTTDDPSAATGLAGKSVLFTLGSGTPQTCSGTTNATGVASCSIASVSQTVGPSVPVAANFAGDTYYQPSSASATTAVSGSGSGGGRDRCQLQQTSGISTTSGGTATAAKANMTTTASGGEGTVTISGYPHDPVTAPAGFVPTCFFDVSLSPANTFTSVVINDCNPQTGTTLVWFNPSGNSGSGEWESVVGDPGPTVSAGPPLCIDVTLDGKTSPNLSQLTGTVFAAAHDVSGLPSPLPPPEPPPLSANGGYWLVASDGGIFSFGGSQFFGSTGAQHLNKPVVGMTSTPDGNGYWLVASDGGIFAFGDASFFGSTGAQHLNQPIVGMDSAPGGQGYWLVASDGGIFAFGNAKFFGSTGNRHLNKPIVGMVSTADGGGYWMVASDGGIFAFGDARYFGSTGAQHLNQPIVGMATTPDGGGYWLVASDGGIFAFGDASFFGSTGNQHLNKPIVGMASTPDGKGYWLVASDGGIFSFGDAPFIGSTGAQHLNQPIVGMAALF
jgi:uncharacterized repeat protein (TIGR01451 family)